MGWKWEELLIDVVRHAGSRERRRLSIRISCLSLYAGGVLRQVSCSQTLMSYFSLFWATPLGIHDDCQKRNAT